MWAECKWLRVSVIEVYGLVRNGSRGFAGFVQTQCWLQLMHLQVIRAANPACGSRAKRPHTGCPARSRESPCQRDHISPASLRMRRDRSGFVRERGFVYGDVGLRYMPDCLERLDEAFGLGDDNPNASRAEPPETLSRKRLRGPEFLNGGRIVFSN